MKVILVPLFVPETGEECSELGSQCDKCFHFWTMGAFKKDTCPDIPPIKSPRDLEPDDDTGNDETVPV